MSKKFIVPLRKEQFVTGHIVVEADDEEHALKQVVDLLSEEPMQSTDSRITWDEAEYIDLSFDVDGNRSVEEYEPGDADGSV